MSWQVKVKLRQEIVSNALRFRDKSEAEAYARDLYRRWTLVETFVVIETEDEPNAVYPLPDPQWPDWSAK